MTQPPSSEPNATQRPDPPTRSAGAGEAPPAPASLGRYRILLELGRGAMGRVWKAWDTELHRTVALKQVLASADHDPSLRERFQREARLCAQLHHPHIVAIHDVGRQDGIDYFACEYVAGRTLAEILREPVDLPVAVGWIAVVAEALAHAHGQGVIHRDVKPGNILVDAEGKPFVADFGLAKSMGTTAGVDRAPLTVTGDLLGTPGYMSPEQAAGEGEGAGPATDQFSLGVILYEAITGRRPFEGTSLREVLNAIVDRDPPRPRTLRPGLAPDLEAVCLKALEKPPGRRYPSMAAFAADLRRYLAGEPVSVPSDGTARLALRRAARRWRVWAAGAVVAAAAVGLPIAWIQASRAYAREAAAQEALRKSQVVSATLGRWNSLGDELRRLEEIGTDSSLTSDGRRTALAGPWAAVESFRRQVGTGDAAAEAMAGALAGWAGRLAGFEEEAIAAMRGAAERDPDLPYGALFEALAHLAVVLEARELVSVQWGPEGIFFGPPPPETEAARRARALIPPLLERARRATVWGREEAQAFGAALDAVAAEEAGDAARAETGFTSALASPSLRPFEAGLRLARAHVRYRLGRLDGATVDAEAVLAARPRSVRVLRFVAEIRLSAALARERLGEDGQDFLLAALRRLDEAARLDPADPNVHNLRALGLVHRAEAQEREGRESRASWEEAAEACGRCLERQPEHLFARYTRVRARLGLVQRLESLGTDGTAALAAARADVEELVRRDPEGPIGPGARGGLHAAAAEARFRRGQDPAEEFRAAQADLEEAVRRDPGAAWAENELAQAYAVDAQCRLDRDEDPGDRIERALIRYDRVAARAPDAPEVLVRRGLAHRLRGVIRSARGEEPRPDLERAIADFEAALKLRPGHGEAFDRRGQTRLELARATLRAGGDPIAEIARAEADATARIEGTPGDPAGWHQRALARSERGDAEEHAGRDATASRAASVADLEQALQRAPDSTTLRAARAQALASLARARTARGGDPRPDLRLALADLDFALERERGEPVLHHNRGITRAELAAAEAGREGDARTWWRAAAEDFDLALRALPGVTAHSRRAEALWEWGMAEADAGGDPREPLGRALADIEVVLAGSPGDPGWTERRAMAAWTLGTALHVRGQDGRAWWEKARTDLDALAALAPGVGELQERRGRVREDLGDRAGAAKVYEEALKSVPALDPGTRAALEAGLSRCREGGSGNGEGD